VHSGSSADEVLAVLRKSAPVGAPVVVAPLGGAVAGSDLPVDTQEWLHSRVSGPAGAGGAVHG
jgi:hypothetical protein